MSYVPASRTLPLRRLWAAVPPWEESRSSRADALRQWALRGIMGAPPPFALVPVTCASRCGACRASVDLDQRRNVMQLSVHWAGAVALALASMPATVVATPAAEPYVIYLSNNFVGNDWRQ